MMHIDEWRKFVQIQQEAYRKADRAPQGKMLDEMMTVTGLHRKRLIQLLGGNLERHPRRRQRGKVYGPELDAALKVIAESFDYLCAERLTPNLVWIAEQLEAQGELELSPQVRAQLGQISLSTVRRRLSTLPSEKRRLRPKGRPYGSTLNQAILMKRLPWDEGSPGTWKATWCTTAVPRLAWSMYTLCNGSTWPPVGASRRPSWDAVTA